LQEITLSSSGKEIYCGLENKPLLIIAVADGATVDKIPGAAVVIVGPSSAHRIIARKDRYMIDGPNQFDIAAMSFGLLSAALSPSAACIAEPNAGVRCIDLVSGKVLWHHKDLGADHLAFNTADQRFYCVSVRSKPVVARSLIRLAENLVDCDQVVDL